MSKIQRAIDALLDYEQTDGEGVIVKASPQAIHEVVDEIKRLTAENARLESENAHLKIAYSQLLDRSWDRLSLWRHMLEGEKDE